MARSRARALPSSESRGTVSSGQTASLQVTPSGRSLCSRHSRMMPARNAPRPRGMAMRKPSCQNVFGKISGRT